MALVLKDRVKETTTSTGTGAVTLAGAAPGFQSFSVIGNANTTYYAIVSADGLSWEVGRGTYTSSGTSLSRDTVLESSNSGALVDFAAGTKEVFVTYPAERSLYVDGSSITPASSATLPITSGGTGQSTAVAAFDALSPANTKGDLIVSNGTDNVRLAVGANDLLLTADSTAATGIAWKAGPSATITIDNKTGAYTVVSTDLGRVINCTANTFTVSLTAAATLGAGFNCWIWNTSTTASNVITIDPAGSETIDGVSTLTLRRGEGVQIVCDGTNWQTNAGKELRSYAENFTATSTRPVASAAGAVAIGATATASGSNCIAIGASNTASGTTSSALGGSSNSVPGQNSVSIGGANHNVTGDYSTVIFGQGARPYQNFKAVGGFFNTNAGDAQWGVMSYMATTSDATPKVITNNNETSPSTGNIEHMQLGGTYAFRAMFVAKTSAAGTNVAKAWEIVGVCKRGSSGNAAFVGTPMTTIIAQDSGASAWTLEPTIVPGTNGANGFSFTFTGAASTNIRISGYVYTAELIFT